MTKSYFFSAIWCILFLAQTSEPARILAFFPVPSISHQLVFRPLTQELAKRGHEVIVITPDPAFPKGQAPTNLTEIDVHDLSYKIWNEEILKTATGNANDLQKQMKALIGIAVRLFEAQVKTKEVQDIIQTKHSFDLLLLEACFRSSLALSHVFKAPVIQISSFGRVIGNYETIGAPVHHILYPTHVHQRTYNLTLLEKLSEIYNYESVINIFYAHESIENEMVRRNFGHDILTLSNLTKNVHMLFLNTHPMFDRNQPVPPGVVYLWGLQQKPEMELPGDIKSYLDSSNYGVVYISFGTNINSTMLPLEKIRIFMRVFSQTPYNILWKWDGDELPGSMNNIKIGKWFPQNNLLKHPKIKLFITQGGLQSTDESITAGVPLIGIPMFGDQWYNTEKYLFHKIGIKLDFETPTERDLRNAIDSVIENESYRQNVIRLRTLMYDQPQRPLERAVWWTEHVLRHGGARHLRAPAANMAWAEYLELELVFILLIGIFILSAIFVVIVYKFYRYISSKFAARS